MSKQLFLSDLHQQLGAKMTPFAGYLMPVSYRKGIIDEHLHCRSQAGFFDLSHMGQYLLTGDHALAEMQRLVPSDVVRLQIGQQKYTVLTNEHGGVIDDIVIGRLNSSVMMIVNAACKDKDFNYLCEQLSGRIGLQELKDRALFALQGPHAHRVIEKYSVDAARLSFMQICEAKITDIDCIVSRSGYTGEDGFEFSVENRDADTLARLLLAESGVEPIGLGARDTLRLEAGLCLYGHELDETITPVEADLRWLIRKTDSDYIGSETIMEQLRKGPSRKRIGLLVAGRMPVRQGSVICQEDDLPVGIVTSGSVAPSLGKPVAMAMLQADLAGSGEALFAKVRDHQVPVIRAPLPFHPHRYYR